MRRARQTPGAKVHADPYQLIPTSEGSKQEPLKQAKSNQPGFSPAVVAVSNSIGLKCNTFHGNAS